MTKNEFQVASTLFNSYLKILKKELPSSCTFLSLVKKADKKIYLRANVKGSGKHLFTIPQDLFVTNADLQRIKTLILEKCQQKN